jgi:hypothetical protein
VSTENGCVTLCDIFSDIFEVNCGLLHKYVTEQNHDYLSSGKIVFEYSASLGEWCNLKDSFVWVVLGLQNELSLWF